MSNTLASNDINDVVRTIFDTLHDTFKIKEIIIERRNFNLPLNESKSLNEGKIKYKLYITASVLETPDLTAIFKAVKVMIVGEKDNLLADFKITYSFEIEKNNKYLIRNDDKYTIDTIANDFLNNIVIATTRGVLFSELRGTFLDKSILPITKPEKVEESA